jgi:drug/metabolite transporter (DMT)-like permease
VAGSSWGIYTLRGRGAADALGQTAGNFARTLPLAGVLWLVTAAHAHAGPLGILWAALSGGIASGVGYAVWYRALPYISAVTAAVVQLSVPLIAGLAGVLLLGETVTLRLLVAAALVLGGIGITIAGRRPA